MVVTSDYVEYAVKGGSYLGSMDEILRCDHTNKSY